MTTVCVKGSVVFALFQTKNLRIRVGNMHFLEWRF
jgi:hypothetical protein